MGTSNADARETDVQKLFSFENHSIKGMIIVTASWDIGYPLSTVGEEL